MKINEFTRYVRLYGSNLANWPEILRAEVKAKLESNKLVTQILEQEAEFEVKARLRRTLPDDNNFCNRIMAIVLTQNPQLSLKEKFNLILSELGEALPIPHPRVAFTIILLTGFIYGISTESSMATTSKDTISGLLYERQEIL